MAVGVNIRFGAIVSGFVNGLGQASAAVGQFTTQLNSNLTASYAAADRAQRVFDRGLGRLASNMQSFGRQASVLTAGLALIGATSFKSFAEIDSLKRGLAAVTGSTEAANAEFVKLRKVAELPGLGLTEAAQGSIRLQAVGFSANLAREALLQFGNAVATTGGGKTQLDQITFQLGQLAAKGKVLSQDLRPIIEAAPAIAPILNKAFGSVDPEIISGKLAAAGKSSKDFVEILIGELGKLPRVSGGPKIAMENFGDSVQIAGANFGEAADKALNLTGKINSLGSFIGRAADSFATLGPGSQTAILGVVGLAAAIGPVSLGLGTLINLSPTVVAGLGAIKTAALALATPIGAIATAVTVGAVAVGLLINAVEAYDANLATTIDRNKLYADINNQVSASIAGETSKLNSLLSIAKDETVSKAARLKAVKDLNAISPEYLGNLRLETINTAEATKQINSYTNALTLKAKVQVLSQRSAEAQIEADKVAAKSAKEFADRGRFGADQIAVNIKTTFLSGEERERAQDAEFERLGKARKDAAVKRAQDEANAVNEALKKAYVDANKSGVKLDAPKAAGINFTLLGNDSDLKKDKARLKKLREEIYADQKAGKDTTLKENEAKQLTARIKAANDALKPRKAILESEGNQLSVNERLLKRYTTELKNAGENATKQQRDVVADLTEAVRLDKERVKYATALANVKPIEAKFATDEKLRPAVEQTAENVAKVMQQKLDQKRLVFNFGTVGYYQDQIDKIRNRIANAGLGKEIISDDEIDETALAFDQLKKAADGATLFDVAVDNRRGGTLPQLADVLKITDQVKNARDIVNTTTEDLVQAMIAGRENLRQAGVGLLAGLGESIGRGENPLKSALKSILDVIGGYVIQLGSALLLSSAALLAAAPFTFGITLAPGIGQKLAGAGLILAGGAVKGLAATAFANGGLVYGPTLGLVGEGRGTTRSNPEVIAPLDKLKGIIGGSGGGTQVFIPDLILENEHIRVAFNRANARYNELN